MAIVTAVSCLKRENAQVLYPPSGGSTCKLFSGLLQLKQRDRAEPCSYRPVTWAPDGVGHTAGSGAAGPSNWLHDVRTHCKVSVPVGAPARRAERSLGSILTNK